MKFTAREISVIIGALEQYGNDSWRPLEEEEALQGEAWALIRRFQEEAKST